MRKKGFLGVLLIGSMLLMLAACGNKEPQTATLALDANQSTGYQWQAVQDETLFTIDSEYVEDEKEGEMAGVGGTETFTLTPDKSGTTTVNFYYMPPGETDYEKADTRLSYTIEVDKNMQLDVQATTAEMGGEMDEMPEMPEMDIK